MMQIARNTAKSLLIMFLSGILVISICGFSFKDMFKAKETPAEVKEGQSVQTKEEVSPLEELQSRYLLLEKAHNDLKEKYANIEADRENILKQTKHLLGVRSELSRLQARHESLAKSVGSVIERNRRLHGTNRKIRHELANALGYYNQLEIAYQELYPKHEELIEENAQISLALIEKIDKSPEYQQLQAEATGFRDSNRNLKDEVNELTLRINQDQEQIKNMRDRRKIMADEIESKENFIQELIRERDDLTERNASLAQEVAEAPRRFQKMAQENHLLMQETADMHYNLGVFYTEERNYRRALKEFIRALDFDPNGAKIHYNLGYLYAEQFEEHEKAVRHFQRFLEIEPAGRESEAIRSYLLVQDSMSGKIAKLGGGS